MLALQLASESSEEPDFCGNGVENPSGGSLSTAREEELRINMALILFFEMRISRYRTM